MATHNEVNKDIGWPDLTQHITKQDASFLTGKTILDYEYKPTYGLLGQPFQMRLNGYFGNDDSSYYTKENICLMSRRNNSLGQIYDTNTSTGETSAAPQKIIDVERNEWEMLAGPTGDLYTTPIEKSQYIWRGPNVRGGSKVQPSLHCGVYPVPRLTTSDLTEVPKKFTDIEMLWDVDVEMFCSYDYATMDLTHYDKPYLVPFENATFINKISSGRDTYFQNQYSTVGDKYIARKNKLQSKNVAEQQFVGESEAAGESLMATPYAYRRRRHQHNNVLVESKEIDIDNI